MIFEFQMKIYKSLPKNAKSIPTIFLNDKQFVKTIKTIAYAFSYKQFKLLTHSKSVHFY